MRAVLVPIKAFARAKLRLAGALDAGARRALAQELAARVIGACGGVPCFVACDDTDVAAWAEHRGAEVLWTPGLGLSGAVGEGVARLRARGFALAVVCHADLPLVPDLSGVGHDAQVTLAPDRRLDGTNVACVPTDIAFQFSYGPGSFTRHVAEARRLAFEPRIVYDWRLANDLDVPDDLVLVR